MRRDPVTGLVRNEKLTLLTLVELGDRDVYAYALTKFWKEQPDAQSLSYSTLYRCLDQLEHRGFVESRQSAEDSGGPSRRVYRVTTEGHALASQLEIAAQERLDLPSDGTVQIP